MDSMQMCDGCANAGDETIATCTVETWDEGDGWIVYHYCNDCYGGTDDKCDRCDTDGCVSGTALCQHCIDDYNEGRSYSDLCDKCRTRAECEDHDDLSGNGEVYTLCQDCADEMYDAWDYERQEPRR